MSKTQRQYDDLLQLIDHVYSAALDEEQWSNVAPEIAHTFGSSSTTLMIERVGASSQILSMTENVSARIDAYRDHYWKSDIWVERAVQRIGMSRVGSSRDIVSDTEFQETEFYRDWCRHLDVFYVVGAVFPSGPGELGVLGIHRPRSSGAYDEDDKYFVSRFLPHLQRALRVREQVGRAGVAERLSWETLNRCDTAAFLVAADGRLVFLNHLGEALLAAGTAVRSCNGRLTTIRRDDAQQLSALIHAACDRADNKTQSNGVMCIRPVNGQKLSVLVSPFRLTSPGRPQAGAIVFVRDPNRLISAAATLRALFQLTPAEARIAEALAQGRTLQEIATAQRATLQTVRKQLKGIFAKTDTNRQAECVAVILRSVASLARG